jgi:glycosyltransferase involved in cell wall biosynthesis
MKIHLDSFRIFFVHQLGRIELRVAIFLPSLCGGGAEKVMVTLAQGFCSYGLKVDLVLARAEGPYLAQVPREVRIIDLNVSRVLFSLPSFVGYLRSKRPAAILTAMDHANVVALLARRLSGVSVRTIVSIHANLSDTIANASSLKTRISRYWIRPFYPWADAVVAVSHGVAKDLVSRTGLPLEKVRVIYNPVVTSELFSNASKSLDHPWFQPGEPPVILGVGRLTDQKDFQTLIHAFARVRGRRAVRLMILGEGEKRSELEALVNALELDEDVALPGFVENPYSYMRAAALFVLPSRWEGFGNVLAEAMACGTPVVSTNCPSGPAEILEDGRWGSLVPVGDVGAMAEAINIQLASDNADRMKESVVERFYANRIVNQYLDVLFPQRN